MTRNSKLGTRNSKFETPYYDFMAPDALHIQQWFEQNQPEIVSLTRRLVLTESPSQDESGSRGVVQLLADAASGISCVTSIERVDAPGFGQHLVIRAFQDRDAPQVLFVGHTDTVHPRGSLEQSPWREESNRIYAPGIFDMKANCALAISVLKACDDLKITPSYGLTFALTCDEEIGSFSGWPLLEKLARQNETRCVFVLEPPAPGGAVKTGRKGTGIYSLKVEGRAAHAGLDPEKGASAILELARQIERLHEMNNSGRGISVNVGVIQGGTRSNVVAAEAAAEIDTRFSTPDEMREVDQAVLNLKPVDERVRLIVTGGVNRPPLERTKQVEELYRLAQRISATLGFELGEAQVGGASDGNFLAGMGIPVLDGLGIDGGGAHAAHEHIYANDIPRRGALITSLIASV